MSHYLISYRKSTQRLESCEEIPGDRESLTRAMTRQVRNADSDLEVVLLTADSLETLKRTHGRYFYSLGELLDRLSERIERLEDRLDRGEE